MEALIQGTDGLQEVRKAREAKIQETGFPGVPGSFSESQRP